MPLGDAASVASERDLEQQRLQQQGAGEEDDEDEEGDEDDFEIEETVGCWWDVAF